MIKHAIYKAFEKKAVRGWDKWPRLYVAIDLHDVIIPGTYTRNNIDRNFYPNGKEVLQWLTHRKDMCLILYTSSHQDSIDDIVKWLAIHDIRFNHINENPECPDNDLCSFSKSGKFYFDVLCEDKAGFVGETDWGEIKKALIKLGEWDKKESNDKW